MLKSAIILVGGKGSRFSDIKSLPKHLALIHGEPIIVKIINLFRKHDINEIIFPLGYKKNFYKRFYRYLWRRDIKFKFEKTINAIFS